ncbi:endoplasmic reticulum lectin 1 isoform X2 [Vanessa cardui]|uniref:endoplasmic reticulum lectin 1 isoform X2 n=1 Tax=Vanessa cardui TaxID=171605 RepID=UPI001F143DFB|nr:endoplasmic reticulum lectin 1 isoform X2 [Vanessa cardui]
MKSVCLLVISAVGVLSIEHDFKGFDDSILFGINWPGVQESLPKLEDGSANREVVKVTTSHHEKYECRLPELHEKETTNIEEYDGPSPINLLKPLFTQKICSYRLESYWSYEVCHGRYIRQYHEEREGKNVKTQEYSLGHWSADRQAKLEADLKAAQDNKVKLKTTKVEGMSLPYIEMTMDEGTVCDLSGKPRLTRVLYVCYTHSKHEIYSFKETATCEYEIIILSPLLCEHPLYKQKDVSENIIDCIPTDGAPKKPRNLLKSEVESLRFNHQTIKLMNNDGETHLKLELHPLSEEEDLTGDSKATPLLEKAQPVTDDSPVRAFLNGENCLNGGTGWWKYEFCYGKHVVQYHVDRAGEKTTLLLGKYDEQAHLDWIKENRGKAPKPIDQRTSVSHFYSGGDVCDKTSKPRQTEVKLKCLENSSSPAQVSLYLLEPRTCHYILGVESPLICDILPLADENGLIKSTKLLPEAKDKSVEKKLENEDDIKEKDVNKFGFD